MILVLHIIVALGSLVAGTILLARPSVGMLHATYSLTAAALTSGTYMVWHDRAQLLQACATGLLYIATVSAAIVLGRRRLARETARVHPGPK